MISVGDSKDSSWLGTGLLEKARTALKKREKKNKEMVDNLTGRNARKSENRKNENK